MSGMNCREYESELIELARNGSLDREDRARVLAHVGICDACRTMLQSQKRLNIAASILTAEAGQTSMPPQAEHVLLAEFESAHRTRRVERPQRRRFVYGVLGGAVAASLAVLWWLAYRPAPKVELAISAPAAVIAAASAPATVQPTLAVTKLRPAKPIHRPTQTEPEQPFIAIPYTLPVEAWERTDVVRMDMPVSALVAAGLPMGMVDPGAEARTDVLVGQDGRARAVRLISISLPN